MNHQKEVDLSIYEQSRINHGITTDIMHGIVLSSYFEYKSHEATPENAPIITIKEHDHAFRIEAKVYWVSNDQDKETKNNILWLKSASIEKLIYELTELWEWCAQAQNNYQEPEKWEQKYNNKD